MLDENRTPAQAHVAVARTGVSLPYTSATFASPEGETKRQWLLSCYRRLRARNELEHQHLVAEHENKASYTAADPILSHMSHMSHTRSHAHRSLRSRSPTGCRSSRSASSGHSKYRRASRSKVSCPIPIAI